MERPRSLEYKVGIFVAIATIVTVGFIMALGGDKALFQKTSYLLLKQEETKGLSIGSIVQVAGVRCGYLDHIEFDSDNHLILRMKIEDTYMARITEGSTIGVRTQGALGDKYLLIKPGPASDKPLKSGDFITAELEEDLFSTLGKSGGRVEKIFDILDNVERLVKGLNERHIAQNAAESINNLKISTTVLAELVSSINSAENKTSAKKSLTHFESILRKIDSGSGTLGGLINDPTVHEDLKSLLGGAKRSKLLKYLIRQTIQKGDEEAQKK